jgi:DNA-binding MarR family transcriptional regulator
VKQREEVGRSSLPVLPCACANLRRAARAVTRLYNRALRPVGIEITQFTLLTALNVTEEITQGDLADLLALDSTTVTRVLSLVKKRRWVRIRHGQDRRQRLVCLTAAGREKLRQSMPRWTQAQTDLERAVGRDAFVQLGELLAHTAARSAG